MYTQGYSTKEPLPRSWKRKNAFISVWQSARIGRQIDQNENMAAFFLVPNMYTSAWLMKSPTVIPMVTVIIALPMSIPLPDAVIAPPSACERPDLGGGKKASQFAGSNKVVSGRTGTKKSTPVTMTVKAVPPNIRE